MQILIKDGVIIAAASVGWYSGGVEFFGKLPDDFRPYKYLWYPANVEYDEDGNVIDPPECHIVRKETKYIPHVDDDGNEYTEVVTESNIEYGYFRINHDAPVSGPVVTDEQRLTAVEDAMAEIINILMGGEDNG